MAHSQDSKAFFVICADGSAKHSEWLNSSSTDQHGKSAPEVCVSSDFVQLIEEPTHISGNRLDLTFTDVLAIVKSEVCE